MWVSMVFETHLSWRIIFLSMFTSCVAAKTLMVTGSTVDSKSTVNDVDTPQSVAQGRSVSSCGPGTERCSSVGHDIITSSDETTRHLTLTTIIDQSSFTVVGDVTGATANSPVTETLGPFAGDEDATATKELTTIPTQIAIDGSQNNTTHLSGNYFNITGANSLSTGVNWTSADISRSRRNDSWEFYTKSNATQSGTFVEFGNATVSSVEDDYWQQRLSVALNVYSSPFVIVIGTLGNAVSIITFRHRNFRYTSTGFILTALSAVDIAQLNVFLLFYWLMAAYDIHLRNWSRITCKLYTVAGYYFQQLAAWTLILLTVERTISVWYPLRCKELCSKRRIVIIWVIIAMILFTEHTFLLVSFDLVPISSGFDDSNTTKVMYGCNWINDYWLDLYLDVWSVLDAVMGDLIPFLVIVTGNTLTIIRIVRSYRERKSQMGVVSTSKPVATTTVMLIGISAMFVILNIPIDCLYLYFATTDWHVLVQEKTQKRAIVNLAFAIGTLCYNANNTFEFIVYFASGRKFREAFLETFRPCRKTKKTVQRTNEGRNANRRVIISEM